MATKLSLRIHQVKCVDETGGWIAERVGDDEIYLGGFAVINANGDTQKINPVSIYPNFDDGDVKVFNPPKVFHTINMGVANEPKTFAVGLVLIEKDAGGMTTAVTRITEFAETKIKERLALLRANPGVVPLLGAALLKSVLIFVAPHIIDFVKRSIISAFNDEIFTPNIATVDIPSPNFTWSGSLDSAQKTVSFRDHDGTYQLTYDWLLS
jgi:hypothetical protein